MRVVTVNAGRGGGPANPNNEIWVTNPDLTKVDEVGFADLMPGSGHGTGGYIHLSTIEVFGKPVSRAATTASNRDSRLVFAFRLVVGCGYVGWAGLQSAARGEAIR